MCKLLMATTTKKIELNPCSQGVGEFIYENKTHTHTKKTSKEKFPKEWCKLQVLVINRQLRILFLKRLWFL